MYNLLIVDDEAAIREGMMGFNWAKWGFRAAASAPSGRKALTLMEQTPIDLVITDIRMPAMDGLELSRQVRTRYPGCMVVILTGYREFEYAQTALKAGVFDYLLKPLDMGASEPLFMRVRAELDARGRRYERARGMEPSVARPTECAEEAERETEGPTSRAIRQAVEFIERNFERKLTLQDVAGSVYLNSSYFSSQFKQQMGVNFVDHLTRVRMERAKVLLEDPEVSIAEVGERVGYQSPQYFADSFRRYTGMSPQQYRKSRTRRATRP